MTELLAGALIDERYAIVSQLGEGGMSVVYEAQHREMNRTVALKVLKSAIDANPEKMTRFRVEAQVLSCLQHPNIVSVYSIGLFAKNNPYIAMELLTGRSLSGVIAEDGPQPYAKMLPLFSQVCDALEYAHSQGVIHRDIKPSNLIIEESAPQNNKPAVKVVDFGIAKVLDNQQDLTKTTAIVGSVLYMSPQRCAGRGADVRSDIYSLGCTLFEALTGRPPFQADLLVDLVTEHQQKKPPGVNEVYPQADIPDSLQKVINCCLSKEDDARYASMADLRDDLQRIAAGEQPVHIPLARGNSLPASGFVMNRRFKMSLIALPVVLLSTLGIAHFLPAAPTSDISDQPYGQMNESELATRTNAVIGEADALFSEAENYNQSMALLKKEEQLLPYLKSQPYWRAMLLRKPGENDVYEAARLEINKDQNGRRKRGQEAIPYLEQAIAEFERAYKEQSAKGDSQSQIAAMRTALEEQYACSLLMHAHLHLQQYDQADEAAENILRLAPRLQYPVERNPSIVMVGAVTHLTADYTVRKKRPDLALNAVIAMRDFYRKQGSNVDKHYVDTCLKNYLATIATSDAAVAARGEKLLWGPDKP